MGRLEGKHWALIAGFLAASATIIGGLDHWGDLTKPAIVAGFLGQLGVLIGSVFAGAPQNPNLTPADNPARRATDAAARGVIILLLAMPLINCGGNRPPTTPRSQPAQVAIEADGVVKAADRVLTGLDQAMATTASPRLSTSVGLTIVKAIREVGVQGQNLAGTLKVIQLMVGTDQVAAASKARQTLVGIRAILASALSPITDPVTKVQVGQLLAGLIEALDKSQQIVDAVKGGGGAMPLLQPAA